MYFIDKLALRAGNEKDPDEAADTVGCCSLRVEHISESTSILLFLHLLTILSSSDAELHEELDGQKDVVEFDFLGKDSIRYYNRVPVEHQVFKNLKIFCENKDPDDDLFDRLTVRPSSSSSSSSSITSSLSPGRLRSSTSTSRS